MKANEKVFIVYDRIKRTQDGRPHRVATFAEEIEAARFVSESGRDLVIWRTSATLADLALVRPA